MKFAAATEPNLTALTLLRFVPAIRTVAKSPPVKGVIDTPEGPGLAVTVKYLAGANKPVSTFPPGVVTTTDEAPIATPVGIVNRT